MAKNKILVALAAILVLIPGAISEYQKLPNGKLQMVFCNVGQGDAAYIKTPEGQDILIDGGPNNKVLDCLSSHMNFWDRKIELVVLTHPQSDHVAGLISVLQNYQVDTFLTGPEGNKTEEWRQIEKIISSQKQIKIANPSRGDTIKVGSLVKFISVWPSSEFLADFGPAVLGASTTRDVNDFSLVFELNYKDKKALFAGDIPNSLLSDLDDVDLLKVPHHGSKTGLSKSFFAQTRPEIAVISVGKNNRFGHPTKEVLEILDQIGAKVLRTDQDGEVVVEW
jgi:competence protein ComEC